MQTHKMLESEIGENANMTDYLKSKYFVFISIIAFISSLYIIYHVSHSKDNSRNIELDLEKRKRSIKCFFKKLSSDTNTAFFIRRKDTSSEKSNLEKSSKHIYKSKLETNSKREKRIPDGNKNVKRKRKKKSRGLTEEERLEYHSLVADQVFAENIEKNFV